MSRYAIFALQLVAGWVVMTFTHELGHLIGGWCGGATLTACDLAPWHLPYSLHHPDPNPQLTLWAGPLLGVAVPAFAASLVRRRWAWFLVDFCILANGTYLALAWLAGDQYLDTPRMLDAGIHPVWIALFCGITISFGYLRFRRDCIAFLSPGLRDRSAIDLKG